MKWYIGSCVDNEGNKIENNKILEENMKYAVNYYIRLLEGTLGKTTWLTLCDEEAMIITRKNNAFKISLDKDAYSLFADKSWEWDYYNTDDVEMMIMERDKISIARRKKKCSKK